uniref:Myosin_tail_1 domain-containing protein n=1 Tax=Steinernema glaseri TaxID=37863 RepID=A0A1I7YVJ0_9BILA
MYNEIEDLKNSNEELEKQRRTLQLELDELVSSKDDFGKNVHELEKAKRQLEQELLNAKTTIEELEDALQIAEDARLRNEVNTQAMRDNFERQLTAKDAEREENRRGLLRQIRDLEGELDSEGRSKANAISQRKKIEAQNAELEQQLELSNRLKEEYNKQFKKAQVIMKECQNDVEEARQAKEDAAAALRESERRYRGVEAENIRLSETVETLNAQKRALEQECEELEELRGKGGQLGADEKRRLEAKIAKLEEDLEEEQTISDTYQDKYKKAQSQLEQMTIDLSTERSLSQKAEAEKQACERNNRELRNKIMELETNAQARAKAQIAALESRLQHCEDQYNSESAERATAARYARRMEKKCADVVAQLEEERKNAEDLKQQIERSNNKCRLLRRQLDEAEEEASRERGKARMLQREVEDLNESHDSYQRLNSTQSSALTSTLSSALNSSLNSSLNSTLTSPLNNTGKN